VKKKDLKDKMRMGKSVKLKTYKLMEIAKFKGVKL